MNIIEEYKKYNYILVDKKDIKRITSELESQGMGVFYFKYGDKICLFNYDYFLYVKDIDFGDIVGTVKTKIISDNRIKTLEKLNIK